MSRIYCVKSKIIEDNAMADALINPDILRWAMRRADVDVDGLAIRLSVKAEKVAGWLSGGTKPTFKQAQNVARVLSMPFGYFFLRKVPVETVPIPDLRTVSDRAVGELTVDLRQVISDVLRKQDWYREYLRDQGITRPVFVGKYSITTPSHKIADDLSKTLALTMEDRRGCGNQEKFFELLRDRAELAGIWVLKSGIVGDNTHRVLDVAEFRGFAICDRIVPLVFINGSDAKAAQIFTLVHELAHIWLGESGISNFPLANPKEVAHGRIEKLCNAVAAEVLVPHTEIENRWHGGEPLETNATKLARVFCVSTVVVARRAYELNLTDWSEYDAYYRVQESRWKREKEQREKGGDYYRNLPIKNGRRFTSAVIQSVYEQRVLLRDAGRLLGIHPSKIDTLATKLGVR